ncbi:cortactin-binding protein 2 [Polypterus senegalus]|uniref:cortactin-binding protein 2 n=1 Tax=Polypterus senegalus TaxID=55291 RepID=UPI00196448C7|nr:cortactin-binding protein 2 [Polypterus senegalus]
MATEGASGEQPPPIQTLSTTTSTTAALQGTLETKCEFNMDNLSKAELLTFLSIMEGELEARDLVIEALRARRKEVFIQERYGRFNLTDPFLALQRDFEASTGEKDRRPICTSPLAILEAVMSHCKRMQERMSAQLAAAESKQKKLEEEKSQLLSLEQEHKKLSAQLKDEQEKNKQIVMMLVKECKHLATKIVEESQKFDELSAKLEEETKKANQLEEELAAEKKKGQQMEAQMEKQLSDFDTEREQLRARLGREETRVADLKVESENLLKEMEQLRSENDSKQDLPDSQTSKTRTFTSISIGTDVINLRSTSCQTDMSLSTEQSIDGLKKSPLTIPVKPSSMNYSNTGHLKGAVTGNIAATRPTDKAAPYSSSGSLSAQTENGPSGGGPEIHSGTTQSPSNPVYPSPSSSGISSPNFPPAPSVHSLHSSASLHQGVSTRVQAARFRFQSSPTEHDQNGITTQSPPSRDLSPTNRDNFAAKQQARHTVTQVLSRFTSPQTANTLRPCLPHSASEGGPFPGRLGHQQIGLKSPNVARIDRGNPPPIPPKKPGLSQTPSPPHPPIKMVSDGSRSSSTGLAVPSKSITPPSSSPQGNRLLNEETLHKSTSPQLPPKPAIDIPGAGGSCPVPALTASQVGAWPTSSPRLHQSACSECPFVAPTSTSTIACSSSINSVSPSSCSPCDKDSPLVTASGWCTPLASPLTCGGPVPLAGRPTLLHQAATQGNVTLLSMLLNEDRNYISHLDEDGNSALYSAAKYGHTDCVKLLLTTGACVNISNKNGFTPLHIAAANGHFRCTDLLLRYEANVNFPAIGGETPLYQACASGNDECIQVLLATGADRTATTANGSTPLHAAVNSGHISSMKLLMYYDVHSDMTIDNETENVTAFDYVNSSKIKTPSFEGSQLVFADLINHSDNQGWTAAHIAASKGFKDCLEVLCSHSDLDVEKRDNCNRTVHDVATDDCKHLLENLYAFKVILQISQNPSQQICSDDVVDDRDGTAVGVLTVRKHTGWDDIAKSLCQTVTNHFHLLTNTWKENGAFLNASAEIPLGLDANSILKVQIGDTSWYLGQSFTTSPWNVLRTGCSQEMSVKLKGLADVSLDELTYASLIPLQMLQNYVRLVEQYRNVIFHGPEGSCQLYLAQQISQFIKHKQEAAGISCELVTIKVDANLSKKQLIETFTNCGFLVKESTGCKNVIVVLENLEQADSLSELLGDLAEALENRGPGSSVLLHNAQDPSGTYFFQEGSFLIGTLAKPRLHGPELLVQQHFRWVQLRWDGEPIRSLLQKYLKRKLINKLKGQIPLLPDLVCKAVEWICSVWHQLNSCLSCLGTPEALIGPEMFFSCPVVLGHHQFIVKWLSRLWNAVVIPRVEEAILAKLTMKRQCVGGQSASKKNLSQGQQALVKTALSILLNKAVLQGCPLPKKDMDEYLAQFQGVSFPLSVITNGKNNNKKSRDLGSWRKANTSPRKKTTQSWNKHGGNKEGALLERSLSRSNLHSHQSLDFDLTRVSRLDQSFSVCSDDENDLMQELQSMCSSKSEPDITKIVHFKNDLIMPSGSSQQFSVHVDNDLTANPLQLKVGGCFANTDAPGMLSSNKRTSESGSGRLKSFLPVPMNKNAQHTDLRSRGGSSGSSSSSSNTRQLEINNNSPDESWNLHSGLHENK